MISSWIMMNKERQRDLDLRRIQIAQVGVEEGETRNDCCWWQLVFCLPEDLLCGWNFRLHILIIEVYFFTAVVLHFCTLCTRGVAEGDCRGPVVSVTKGSYRLMQRLVFAVQGRYRHGFSPAFYCTQTLLQCGLQICCSDDKLPHHQNLPGLVYRLSLETCPQEQVASRSCKDTFLAEPSVIYFLGEAKTWFLLMKINPCMLSKPLAGQSWVRGVMWLEPKPIVSFQEAAQRVEFNFCAELFPFSDSRCSRCTMYMYLYRLDRLMRGFELSWNSDQKRSVSFYTQCRHASTSNFLSTVVRISSGCSSISSPKIAEMDTLVKVSAMAVEVNTRNLRWDKAEERSGHLVHS